MCSKAKRNNTHNKRRFKYSESTKNITPTNGKVQKTNRDEFTYPKKFISLSNYLNKLNLEEKNLFYKNGSLPCPMCRDLMFLGINPLSRRFKVSNTLNTFDQYKKLVFDHKKSCFNGGDSNIDNCNPICRKCNSECNEKVTDKTKDIIMNYYITHGAMITDEFENECQNNDKIEKILDTRIKNIIDKE